MYDDWCLACVACALILYTMMMHCPIACLGFIDELYLSVICDVSSLMSSLIICILVAVVIRIDCFLDKSSNTPN